MCLPVVQIQGAPGHPVRYSSMADCCQTMLREEGASAFWRGTLSSFMKVPIALFRVYVLPNAAWGTLQRRAPTHQSEPPASSVYVLPQVVPSIAIVRYM